VIVCCTNNNNEDDEDIINNLIVFVNFIISFLQVTGFFSMILFELHKPEFSHLIKHEKITAAPLMYKLRLYEAMIIIIMMIATAALVVTCMNIEKLTKFTFLLSTRSCIT
jgi:hypothetical protein